MGFLSGVGKFLGNVGKGAIGLFTGNPGATLSAGASIIGGLIGKSSQENTNKAQIDLSNQTNQWNLEQWNRQNEYNTPSAQRQRLEDAGLNVNHYGLDGTGNAGAVSPATMPEIQNPGLSIQAALANVANVAADTELKKAQANNLNAGAELSSENAETVRQMRSGQLRLMNVQIELTEEQKKSLDKMTNAQVDNLNASSAKLKKETDQLDSYMSIALRQMSLDEFRANLDKRKVDSDIQKALCDMYVARQRLEIDRKESSARVSLFGSQVELVKSQKEGQDNSNIISAANADYAVENAGNQSDLLRYQARQAYRDDSRDEYTWSITQANNSSSVVQYVDMMADDLGRLVSPLKGIIGVF